MVVLYLKRKQNGISLLENETQW